jgi:Leu/Phe-tRNA-protein transferase
MYPKRLRVLKKASGNVEEHVELTQKKLYPSYQKGIFVIYWEHLRVLTCDFQGHYYYCYYCGCNGTGCDCNCDYF